MDRKAEDTDLYLQPDIYGYSVADFEKGSDLIKNGIKEAVNSSKVLSKLPKRNNELHKTKLVDSINVGKIIVKGVELNNKRFYT